MFSKVWFRIILIVILLAVLAGAGFWVYNLGLMQAAAANGELPAYTERALSHYNMAYPYGMGMHYFFSPFRFIGGLIFLFVVIGLLRAIFFPRWMYPRFHHHMHGYGRWQGWREGDVPPMVEEWHRKMHEKGNEAPKADNAESEK